jgi:RNA polymerase sigma factor (TIGR02999 family)
MSAEPAHDITRLLHSVRNGDRRALDALLPIVYVHLHGLASRTLAGGGRSDVLDTTSLVHEAYLKLHDTDRLTLEDRKHFFAVAAMAMRQIVVDHARQRAAVRHGGQEVRVDLDRTQIPVEDGAETLLALDEALTRLRALNERSALVVEMRFFGGLSVEETAETLGIDPRTVKRDWRKARALLYASLAG